MSNRIIDLNSDLGELPESIANGSDFELMRFISSANIACGGHAGDDATMRETLVAAKQLNVAVGAHPSYPDRRNFGRVAMSISPEELENSVRQQIARLAELAGELGIRLVHVKPHGALYHAARDRTTAVAIGKAVQNLDARLVLVGQAGSPALDHWREMGLGCIPEAFADRTYERDGTLRSRNLQGALLPAADAAKQAIAIVTRHAAITSDGGELRINAKTLCIHSDTPGAAAIAQEIHRQLLAEGFTIRSFADESCSN